MAGSMAENSAAIQLNGLIVISQPPKKILLMSFPNSLVSMYQKGDN
jgi:hypothetical protein